MPGRTIFQDPAQQRMVWVFFLVILIRFRGDRYKTFTRLTNEKIITTIIETSSDYMNDLEHLKPEGRIFVLVRWHNRIKVEYMKGFLQKWDFISFMGFSKCDEWFVCSMSIMTRVFRKCQLTDLTERNVFSNKISKEIMALEQWFSKLTSSLSDEKVSTIYPIKFERTLKNAVGKSIWLISVSWRWWPNWSKPTTLTSSGLRSALSSKSVQT